MRRRLISILILSLSLAGTFGCALSRTGTSTGLSYWPPGSPPRELPPELVPKVKKTDKPQP